MSVLPTENATFLLTDIEGSTNLLQLLEDQYVEVVGIHRRLLREAFHAWGGKEIDTAGDGFFAVFPDARDAVNAAVTAQRAIASHPWPEGAPVRVRIGMHTGQAVPAFGGYIGLDVHRTARIMAAGYGGQTLLSHATQSAVEGPLPGDITLRDLGEHRLKDLLRSERIFQAVTPDLPSAFPPLRTLDVVSNNLPIQLTSFIGREREMGEVKRLLTAARLLTIQGAGGAGKTRLAIQVAAEVISEFDHGVWLVDLAPLSDPALVVQAVSSTLSIRETAGRTLQDALLDAIRPKRLLLILDNCEHLASACAHVAEQILRSCAHLRILATSREPLAIPGEVTYVVPTLSLPSGRERVSPEQLGAFEAVRLFAERAAAIAPGFSLTEENAQAVMEICQRLDGMPLAIELAAARVRGMSVQQIASRLDDRFRLLTGGGRTALPKHQTLRAAMDWSYELLSAEERALLRQLAVFVGGFTLEAAEAVCADQEQRAQVLDLLTHLVAKSLVARHGGNGDSRYSLLETTRAYAHERMVEFDDERAIRRRHLDWYLSVAQQGMTGIQGPDQRRWLERLERDHDNLRAALDWSIRADTGEEPAKLGVALWRFWYIRGHLSEGRNHLARILARMGSAVSVERASLLNGAGTLARAQGDNGPGRALLEESVALWRAVGNKSGLAAALNNLGLIAFDVGDLAAAEAFHEENLAISREARNKRAISNALTNMGLVAWSRGDHPRARRLYEEGLAGSRELGDSWGLAFAFNGLGLVARDQGEHPRAKGLFEEALAQFRKLGNPRSIAGVLTNLGGVARAEGDPSAAHDCYQEALAIFQDLGDRGGLAACLEGLATVAEANDQPRLAARLLGRAAALREAIGLPVPPTDRSGYDRDVNAVQQRLGPEALAAAWAEGRAMTMEEAVALATALSD